MKAKSRYAAAHLRFQPVRHNHAEFLAKAKKHPGFAEAYDELALKYALASQMLKTRWLQIRKKPRSETVASNTSDKQGDA